MTVERCGLLAEYICSCIPIAVFTQVKKTWGRKGQEDLGEEGQLHAHLHRKCHKLFRLVKLPCCRDTYNLRYIASQEARRKMEEEERREIARLDDHLAKERVSRLFSHLIPNNSAPIERRNTIVPRGSGLTSVCTGTFFPLRSTGWWISRGQRKAKLTLKHVVSPACMPTKRWPRGQPMDPPYVVGGVSVP